MLRVFAWFACCLTSTGLLLTAGADETEEPNSSAHSLVELPDGWHWDRAVADRASRNGDVIQLTTETGRIWAGTGNQNRIITKAPIGEAADAFAEIELVDAAGKWEQCGLLVYQHDDSFVKLVVEHIDGKHYVVMAIEAGNKRKVVAKIEIDNSRAELGLHVDGSKVRGVWRSDSTKSWKPASETTLRRENDRFFAVFSQDADPNRPRHALVRGLRYSKRTE